MKLKFSVVLIVTFFAFSLGHEGIHKYFINSCMDGVIDSTTLDPNELQFEKYTGEAGLSRIFSLLEPKSNETVLIPEYLQKRKFVYRIAVEKGVSYYFKGQPLHSIVTENDGVVPDSCGKTFNSEVRKFSYYSLYLFSNKDIDSPNEIDDLIDGNMTLGGYLFYNGKYNGWKLFCEGCVQEDALFKVGLGKCSNEITSSYLPSSIFKLRSLFKNLLVDPICREEEVVTVKSNFLNKRDTGEYFQFDIKSIDYLLKYATQIDVRLLNGYSEKTITKKEFNNLSNHIKRVVDSSNRVGGSKISVVCGMSKISLDQYFESINTNKIDIEMFDLARTPLDTNICPDKNLKPKLKIEIGSGALALIFNYNDVNYFQINSDFEGDLLVDTSLFLFIPAYIARTELKGSVGVGIDENWPKLVSDMGESINYKGCDKLRIAFSSPSKTILEPINGHVGPFFECKTRRYLLTLNNKKSNILKIYEVKKNGNVNSIFKFKM